MEDFIDHHKDKLSYYYFDNFPLSQNYYDLYINYYKKIIKNIQENTEVDHNLYFIAKLKILSQHDPNVDWHFPIVVYRNHVLYGTGRIVIDKLVFKKENKKTILINESMLEGKERIISVNELILKINDSAVQIYQKKGIILDIYRVPRTFTKDRKNYLNLYKNELLKDIHYIDLNNLDSLVDFLKKQY